MALTFDHGYALLIGVNANNVPQWALPNVEKDTTALRQVLINPERCAYRPENVKTLKGVDATRQGILDALTWLKEQSRADGDRSTAVIYYSGHGWRNDRASPPSYHLIPFDVQEDRLLSTALRAEDFGEVIGALRPERLLVILDCCHAGGMEIKDVLAQPQGFVPAALPPQLLIEGGAAISLGEKGLQQLETGAGRAVLCSSRGEQPSYMRLDGKMSIFTFHLIEALTGHAQPQGGASEVLVSDVLSYVYRHVPTSAQAQVGKEQQPDGRLTGNFPIALVLGGKGLAQGESAPDPLDSMQQNAGTEMRLQASSAVTASHVNTGGGDFVGRDKTVHGDEVRGDKITVGNITGDGFAFGRGASVSIERGLNPEALSTILAPVVESVRQNAVDAAIQAEALRKIEEIKQELAKGKQEDDSRLAGLVQSLVDLVPGAVSTVVSAFTTPILGALTGPVTAYVLGKLRRQRS
jgi:hypothetical protein